MALKLRRRAEVFTNGILPHRTRGRPPDRLRTGAGSFKRLLGSFSPGPKRALGAPCQPLQPCRQQAGSTANLPVSANVATSLKHKAAKLPGFLHHLAGPDGFAKTQYFALLGLPVFQSITVPPEDVDVAGGPDTDRDAHRIRQRGPHLK